MEKHDNLYPKPFEKLGIEASEPVMLAPLAGVSDAPFRRICQMHGADLTFVEMLSATALIHKNKKTHAMLHRDPAEDVCGVQLTGRFAQEVGEATALIEDKTFEAVDINMGCPVRKVVGSGSGSAILKDVDRVYETVSTVRAATQKVLSAKIRIGWDRSSINSVEVGKAIEAAGADYMVVHGRCRSDTYQTPVDLEEIARLKAAVSIPVIGNGNLFSHRDAEQMQTVCKLDGLMVSRGALGNPWVFRSIKENKSVHPSLSDWMDTVTKHVELQRATYGTEPRAAVCMRKHMLWYTKGWPGAKKVREKMAVMYSLDDICQMLEGFYKELTAAGVERRDPPYGEQGDQAGRFSWDTASWDPKFDMDRKQDRGAPTPHYEGAPVSSVVGKEDYI